MKPGTPSAILARYQRSRREQFVRMGLCTNCGHKRDHQRFRQCGNCRGYRLGRQKGGRRMQEPVRQFLPQWPRHVAGSIALQMVRGSVDS